MTDQGISEPHIEPAKRSIWRNLSFVWLVPVLALAVALGVAYQAYSDRGTLIEITFENASGVVAGNTTLRYRDVVIGQVEDVAFTEDLGNVVVSARVDAQVLPFMDNDATFWVVRPEISSQGVSGLSTVVSGVYIEGAWDSEAGEEQRVFQGRETPLLVQPGQAGRRITLEVPSAQQLTSGAPVFFRGIQVGRIEQPMLTEDAERVRVDAFIESPYDAELSEATRFWNASGFEIRLGAQGLTLDVASLTSLLNGGIVFANIYSSTDPLPDDEIFEVYVSEEAARASAFAQEDVGNVPVTVEFNEFVDGIEIGTPVDYRGLQVGEVTDIRIISTEIDEGRKQRLAVDFVLDSGRMGLTRNAEPQALYALLDRLVADGLRAQVGTAGLLSSTVRISLTEIPAAAPARFALAAEPFPVMPSVLTQATSFDATAESLLDRVSSLPLEATLNQVIATLASIEDLAEDPALRAVPVEAAGLLNDARGLVTGDATGLFTDARDLVAGEATQLLNDTRGILAGSDAQAIPAEARAALADLSAIISAFREGGTIASLASAAAQADAAMGPVVAASDALPDIMENLRQLSQTAAALEVEALIATANSVLASADAFISSEEIADVPEALSGALVELQRLLADLTAADVTGSLIATLDAAESASAGLPGLVNEASTAVSRVDGLIASYGARSDFMSEGMRVLREINAAARSISQLARTIERNPSALLTGR